MSSNLTVQEFEGLTSRLEVFDDDVTFDGELFNESEEES
jgi:hypothetical protein